MVLLKFLKGTAKQTCNPKNPTKYIIYLNKNNLFRYNMSKSLPVGRVKWLDSAKFNFNMMITVPEVAF